MDSHTSWGLPGCVTLSKVRDVPEPQSLHLGTRENTSKTRKRDHTGQALGTQRALHTDWFSPDFLMGYPGDGGSV